MAQRSRATCSTSRVSAVIVPTPVGASTKRRGYHSLHNMKYGIAEA